MFLFLYVFGGLVGYDEGSKWDSLGDRKKYEQSNENFSKLCVSDFCKVINKGDFEKVRWWGHYLRLIMRKELEDHLFFFFFFFLWRIWEITVEVLEGHEGEIVGIEVCRSLSWKKYKNKPLVMYLER